MPAKRKRGEPPDRAAALRLQLLLAMRSMGQVDLARDSGTEQSQVSRYIRGQRDVTCATMISWCSALGVRVGWVLTGEEPRESCVTVEPAALADKNVRERVAKIA